MSRPLHVAFVCNEYPPEPHGGIGSSVQSFGRALAARGHQVCVVGLSAESGESVDGPIRVIRISRAERRYVSWLVNRRRLRRRLERLAEEEGLDIIQVPEFEGWLPLAVRDIPVVVRLHLSYTAIANLSGKEPPPGIRLLEKRTLAAHPNWMAVSRYLLDATSATFGLKPVREAVAYVPLPPSLPLSPPRLPWPGPFVLFAGSISERKGALLLAEAGRIVLDRRGDVALVFAGREMEQDGEPISNPIRRIARPHDDRVFFPGVLSRDGVRALMARAAVFALPSALEGLALVVVEAMREGTPVVVPQAPPFDEVVDHEVDGVMVPPRDPAALAAALLMLLDDRGRATALGQAGRRRVLAQFDEETAIRKVLAFYEEVIRAGGRRGRGERAP
ncbi:MAG TPA: glycosyltransferase family 4 protein [Thermoanaerobaculia bacterium]|nr:glycosyltransferase family 4 protein [Thermoanaerobaculia bacterium]